MQKDILVDRIKVIASNILHDNNIELIDTVYRREGGTNVLRILANTADGITIDQCMRMNQVISDTLDKENIIQENYVLEVSSPGLDRPLKTKDDFLRVKGKKIRVHTFLPIDSKKEFVGTVDTADDSEVTILADDATVKKLPLAKISKALLDYKNLLREKHE